MDSQEQRECRMFSAPLASSVLHSLGPQTDVAHLQAVSFTSVKAIRQPPTDTLQATLTRQSPTELSCMVTLGCD